eukprot:COSAG03_NODE_120_length_12312_cov_15.216900_11_plen_127_part_01
MGNALRKQPAAAVDLEELFLQLEQQRAEDSAADPGAQQAQNARATAPAAGPTATGSAWVAEAGLFFVMGMSGWWTANAIYAETPIFVSDTPEEQAIGKKVAEQRAEAAEAKLAQTRASVEEMSQKDR